jgi:hypothetical protein
MKPKLYLETTIPSYLVGWPSRDLLVAAHQQITRDWWESRRTEFDLYASELVLSEVRAGDPQLANRRRGSWRVCRSCRSVARYWN